MQNERLISFLLRTGIAIALLYAGIASFLDPFSWVGFFPTWMRDMAADEILLNAHLVVQSAIGLWLLSGKVPLYSAGAAAIVLFGIIIFNVTQLDILFRDVPILFAALALMATSKPDSRQP